MPYAVSEGDFVNVGSQLVLADADSNNSVVYVDRVYIEVLDGTPAERLYFTDDLLGNDSLVLQANYTVRIAPFGDYYCTVGNFTRRTLFSPISPPPLIGKNCQCFSNAKDMCCWAWQNFSPAKILDKIPLFCFTVFS